MKNERSQPHTYVDDGVVVGFLTDPTLCVGCKACEVACKEWNEVPADSARVAIGSRSYDHSGDLGASTWRHVKFVESESEQALPRWLFLSDVCKHCEHAGCLDACPTGAIRRTEVGSVLVDDDICNGCGYCVVSCPFGVIDRRGRGAAVTTAAKQGGLEGEHAESREHAVQGTGGAFKCTFCYDRQTAGKLPACANACPTDSILFGPLAELEEYAVSRIETLRSRGVGDASVYGAAEHDCGGVGGTHALSILIGAESEQAPALWGQPDDPVAPRVYLRSSWTSACLTALGAFLVCWWAFSL